MQQRRKSPIYTQRYHYLTLLALLFTLLHQGPTPANAQPAGNDWWNEQWLYRVPITINSNGVARTDKPAEVSINFTALLAGLGVNGTFDPNSLRVIEVDGTNQVLNEAVPFQFDPAGGYNATTNAAGTLVVLLSGTTAATAARSYHLYFDLAGKGFSAPTFTPLLTLVDNIVDEGQSSYQIQTAQGTYYYQKEAAGFSSLVDQAGNDWLGYKPTGGAGGTFRGVPNMIHPEGYFHPGATNATTVILTQGPLKLAIKSTTNDGKWEALWEFFPTYVRMTLLKADHAYWFLYEGTPGGTLDLATDLVVRSNGTQTPAADKWTGDLAGPEWAYFADPGVNRAFFAASHSEDNVVDSYYPMTQMAGSMTVFGFGRQGTNKGLTATPSRFTIGLMDTTQFAQASGIINNAYSDLAIQTGSATQNPTPTPTATATASATGVPTLTPTVTVETTPTPTATASVTPVVTPVETATPTPTATAITTPTPATTITNFTAERVSNGVNLQWQTSQEVNTAGFYLYRTSSNGDQFNPLTALLPSRGAQGGAYQFTDETAAAAAAYNYLIVEEKLDGSRIEYRERIIVLGVSPDQPIQLFLPLVSK